jgi:Short chain fatty acid transporter
METTLDAARPKQPVISRVTAFFVYLFERVMPDPFVFAVILTILVAILAKALIPTTTAGSISLAWYNGIFNIFTFGFQMVLIVVTGYSLASSPFIHSGLEKAASLPKSPRSAVSLTIVVGMLASWLNWGFGLVTAALLAREIAKRVRMDFGWLVAAAYTGFVISTEGLSGSIALSQATPGSTLHLVEKTVGHGLPLRETIFARFTLLPVLVLLIALPLVYRFLEPSKQQSTFADPEKLRSEDQRKPGEKRKTFGSALDNAWILNVLLASCGIAALAYQWGSKGFTLELNSVIMICLLLGLLCHWKPVAYVEAVKNAARITGPPGTPASPVRRNHGHHDDDGSRGRNLQSILGFLYEPHPAVLDLRLLSGHHAFHTQRRRPLGCAGTFCIACGKRTSRISRRDHHGCGDGRVCRKHDSAIFRPSAPGDCRHPDAANDGIYGDYFFNFSAAFGASLLFLLPHAP